MRQLVPALAAALLLVAHPLAQHAPSLLVRNVTLIDGNGDTPRTGADVLVREGRIASIEPTSSSPSQPAELTLDGSGLFLLPGLTDAHVHLSGMPWAPRVEQLKRVLQGGVTAVLDVAGDTRTTGDLARAAMAGEIESPTIYYSALFAGPAFFSDPRVVATSLGFRPGDAPWNREIRSDTDLVRVVAEAKGSGVIAIKLYAALDAETVRRIGEEAKRQNIRLVAHATVFPAKPSDLVGAGVNYLAHAAYLVWEASPATDDFTKRARGDFAAVPADGPVMTKLLQSMKDADVSLNPTLWIFAEGPGKDDLAALRTPWMNTITRRAQEIGVNIAAGVDSLVSQGDPLPTLHKELEVMVTGAGLTPLQAITAATRGAAHAIGVEDSRGTVAVGKVADLLIVDANPASDIKNTRRIRYVIKDGRIAYTAIPKER
jgi:imidazolonepropionase-like amidohydrolase